MTAATGDSHFYRSVPAVTGADYLLSAWVRTVVSGSHDGSGGAALVVTRAESSTAAIATGTAVQTEGQWQLVQLNFNSGTPVQTSLSAALTSGTQYSQVSVNATSAD